MDTGGWATKICLPENNNNETCNGVATKTYRYTHLKTKHDRQLSTLDVLKSRSVRLKNNNNESCPDDIVETLLIINFTSQYQTFQNYVGVYLNADKIY